MPRIGLLLCAGALAAACFGCARPTPPTPPAVACTASNFGEKVSYLTASFQPRKGAPLPPTGPLPAGSPYAVDLRAAFAAASPAFQERLCGLDHVYINAAADHGLPDRFEASWGWWRSRPSGGPQRIIAISANFWTEPQPRPQYSVYETELQRSVLPPGSGIRYSDATVDTFPMALLAALAHEMGHIRWYDLVGNPPDSFCHGDFFTAWESVPQPPRWRYLLTLARRNIIRRERVGGKEQGWPYRHKRPPYINRIDSHPTPDQIYGLVATDAPWASPFAAISPDEDFVETYKFKVLTTASHPLTSVTISVPGAREGSANIVADYDAGKKPALSTKTACIPDTF